MIECAMLNPTGDVEADVRTLAGTLPPLMDEFWEAKGRRWHRAGALRLDAVSLSQLWTSGVMRVVTARDGGEPVGILAGLSVPSLYHADRAFQVDVCYGRAPEAERALLDFLVKGFAFMSDRLLLLPDYVDVSGLALPRDGDRTHRVYTRG
jgi:hypothetical protein